MVEALAESKTLRRFTAGLGEDVAHKTGEQFLQSVKETRLIALIVFNLNNSDKFKARRMALSCLKQAKDGALCLFASVMEKAKQATTLSRFTVALALKVEKDE